MLDLRQRQDFVILQKCNTTKDVTEWGMEIYTNSFYKWLITAAEANTSVIQLRGYPE